MSKDPIGRLDDLVERAARRLSELKKDRDAQQARATELEAKVAAAEAKLLAAEKRAAEAAGASDRVDELTAKIERFEKERKDVRDRVAKAADRLRQVLAAEPTDSPSAEAKAEPGGDEAMIEEPAEATAE